MPLRSLQDSSVREALLLYGRQTAKAILVREPLPSTGLEVDGPFGGAFATFRRGALLRGCVGRFQRTTDLCALIADTVRAALADPRFVGDPITLAELEQLSLEISVLSEAERVTDPPRVIVPGRHGVWIRREGLSGCFLPHVASERGWSAEELLCNCCTMKAGLPADAWRDSQTEVLVFTTEVFSERR